MVNTIKEIQCGYNDWTNAAQHFSSLLKKPVCTKWKFFYFGHEGTMIIEPPDEAIEYAKLMKAYIEEIKRYSVLNNMSSLYR